MTLQNDPVNQIYTNRYKDVDMIEVYSVTVLQVVHMYTCEVGEKMLNEFRELRENKMSCGSVG